MRVRIITPVYNDWTSFRQLLVELNAIAAAQSVQLFVSAVDDGSSESADPLVRDLPPLPHLIGCEIIRLSMNVGHQRAIAIGLCVAATEGHYDAAIVMDADGEDPPQALQQLLTAIQQQPGRSFVAQRRRRQETLGFRLSYQLYKNFFVLLTGRIIDFGNFSILAPEAVDRLTMLPELWCNLPAAILRSRLPFGKVPIDRGRRYAGRSKMNYTSLVVHGFSGISAYADSLFVRLLILSGALGGLTVVAFFVLLTLRIFVPAHATPGWATTIVFGLAIITLQLTLTALSSLLMLLNTRMQRLVQPRTEYAPYVHHRELLTGRYLHVGQ